MDKKILGKIHKCLKLSQSSNANEASIALRQAQKLMAQYGVTAEDLELSNISRHDQYAGSSRKPAQWQMALMSLCAAAFECDCVWVGKLNGAAVSFIGVDSQPEISGYAWTVLYRQLKKERADHIATQSKRLKRSTKTRRGDLFAEQWVYAVHCNLSIPKPSVRITTLIEQFKDREFKNLSETSGRTHKAQQRDHASQLAGQIAGNKVRLNQGMKGTQTERLEATQ